MRRWNFDLCPGGYLIRPGRLCGHSGNNCAGRCAFSHKAASGKIASISDFSGYMVVCHDGAIGLASWTSDCDYEVQLGPDGPFARHLSKDVRLATRAEIAAAGLAGVGCCGAPE